MISESEKTLLSGFIDCNAISFNVSVLALDNYEKVFKDLGWELEELNGEELNGWQVDFWYYFKNSKHDFRIMLHGSLWQGNYKLTKVDDESSEYIYPE